MLHQVQVVNRSEDRDALLAKMMKQVDEFGLPSDIEVLRGFVEQQELRFLGEAKCDLDALTFAAAQFVEDAMAKLEAVGKIESTIDGHPILAHESPKQAEVRGASLLDDLLNMEFERNIELLRNKSNQPGALSALNRVKGKAIEQDATGGRSKSAGRNS